MAAIPLTGSSLLSSLVDPSADIVIRWAGLDASGNMWEPLDNLTNCDKAIRDFRRANPGPLAWYDFRAPGSCSPPPSSQVCGESVMESM